MGPQVDDAWLDAWGFLEMFDEGGINAWGFFKKSDEGEIDARDDCLKEFDEDMSHAGDEEKDHLRKRCGIRTALVNGRQEREKAVYKGA